MKKIVLTCAAMSSAILWAGTAQAYNGANQQCREYTRTIYVGGQPREGVGTACLQPDGSWRITSEPRVQATLPETRPREVVVHRDHYYPSHRRYGRDHYYRPRSGLSISIGNQWGPRPYYKNRKHYRKYHRGYDRYHSRNKHGRYGRSGHHWH